MSLIQYVYDTSSSHTYHWLVSLKPFLFKLLYLLVSVSINFYLNYSTFHLNTLNSLQNTVLVATHTQDKIYKPRLRQVLTSKRIIIIIILIRIILNE